jgi:hypothetical protein
MRPHFRAMPRAACEGFGSFAVSSSLPSGRITLPDNADHFTEYARASMQAENARLNVFMLWS